MDNSVFKKKLKITAIVIASIVAVVLIVWFATKGGKDCINNSNYAEALTLEEAIQVMYDNNNGLESPKNYVNYEESVEPHCPCSNGEIRIFKLIDNYRLFLSDDAECNINGESLKSFICKICSDESFLKSRMSDRIKKLDVEDLPTFKFCCEIESVNSMFKEKSLKIGRINSWLSLEKDNASYICSNNNMIKDTYVFTRINGVWQLTLHTGCFSKKNYVEVLTLKEAIMSAYTDYKVDLSIDYYIDYQRSLKIYGFDAILPMWSQQWRFTSVDNYRRFLSDTAECNKGEEPLISFISKIAKDNSFFKSRITLDSYELSEFSKAEIPSFKFYYKINPVMCRGNICGTKTDINSWKELSKNKAVFIISRNGFIEDTYTFSRINGRWFLTGYSPFDQRGLMVTY